MIKKNLGGDRLGSGNKMQVDLAEYARSSHDLGYPWRTTVSPGTIVPFLTEVALPGDVFEIDLNAVVQSLPTLGNLMASFKVQLDVFMTPVSLYNTKLHMNAINVGRDMSSIHLPQMRLRASTPPVGANIDNYQINSSSIFSYINIRGLGYRSQDIASNGQYHVERDYNAIPYLIYFDVYKTYYANKQENVGAIIHNDLTANDMVIDTVKFYNNNQEYILNEDTTPQNNNNINLQGNAKLVIKYTSITTFDPDGWFINWNGINKKITDIFTVIEEDPDQPLITLSAPYPYWGGYFNIGSYYFSTVATTSDDTAPKVKFFDLSKIDQMRELILQSTAQPVLINNFNIEPYNLPFKQNGLEASIDGVLYSKKSNQEGLLLKTYQSDQFNNWINSEWINGSNGVTEITAIDTSSGSFTLDTLNLANHLYRLLNRIVASDGTFDDWEEVVYDHKSYNRIFNPIYLGGLSKELTFQEIFSQAGTDTQVLGTRAGRSVMTDKHKGGKVYAKADTISYITGYLSLTPRIDYSQGNKWDVNLKTMNDFHKPALDGIGYQDLITDKMAWFDTAIPGPYAGDPADPIFKSAGKQTAWLDYQTNVPQVRGDFANVNAEMFMTLNRRYDAKFTTGNTVHGQNPYVEIKDLTTYIDPSKYNFIFAETKLSAMNFWVQIKVDMKARRKMSAKQIPNL